MQHRAPRAHLNLLDVLEEVPLNDVQSNVWAHLTRIDQHSFLAVSQQSMRLCWALVTSAALDLHNVPEACLAEERGNYFDSVLAELQLRPNAAAFTISRWPEDQDLLDTLGKLAPAARSSRGTQLTLCNSGHLFAAGLAAACTLCPKLHRLTLRSLGGADASLLRLPDDVFRPLYGCTTLTQLYLAQGVVLSDTALHTVFRLTQLQSLHLCVRAALLTDATLREFGRLNRLRECELDVRGGGGGGGGGGRTLQVCAPLYASPHLKALRLRNVAFTSFSDAVAGPASPAAALAQLSSLSALRSLQLSDDFCGGARFFATVTRMAHLTHLHLGCLDEAPITGGHLPQLRHLGASTNRAVHLLGTLLPLLGLPGLVALTCCGAPAEPHRADGLLSLGLECPSLASAEAEATALGDVVGKLVGAPQLRLGSSLRLFAAVGSASQLSLGQAAATLHPLAGRVTHVMLQRLHLSRGPEEPVQWGVLRSALPGLQHLELDRCTLEPANLQGLMWRVPALRRLHLREVDCPGLGDDGEWVMIALAVGRLLQLLVQPRVEPALEAACVSAQEEAFGEPRILWLRGEEEFSLQ